MNLTLIINYSSEDNRPIDENQKGWVDSFIGNLQMMFRQILDEKITITAFNEKEDIDENILKEASAMICIISDYYIPKMSLSAREDKYINALKSQGRNSIPVFYVIKNNFESSDLRVLANNIYPLYLTDQDTIDSSEITNFLSDEAGKFYWMRMVDLAYDIHDYLVGISKGEMKVVRPYEKNKNVFLAESTSDIGVERNILKRELQRHGYNVIPESPLPRTSQEFQTEMGKLLKEVDLSIHMIGNTYGPIVEGSDFSTIELQYRLISDWAKNLAESPDQNFKKIRRFIWIANNQKRLDSKQDLFVENVKRDFTTVEGVDVIETTLEDFKNMIREELYQIQKNESIPQEDLVEAVSGDKSVYLIYNQNAPDNLDDIKKKMRDKNIKVLEPDFEKDVLKTRYRHLENLIKMDYALIIQGDSSNEWARIKLLDVFKSPGYGRMKPIQNIGIIANRKVDLSNAGLPDQHVEVMVPESDKELGRELGSFLERKQETI